MTARRPEVKSPGHPSSPRSASQKPRAAPARPADRKAASPRHLAATLAEKSPGIPRVSGSIGFPDRTDRPIFATADRSRRSCARGARLRPGSSGPRLPDSRAFLRVSGSIGFPDRTGRPIFATADRSHGSCARGALRRSGSSGPCLPNSRAFLRAFGFVWFSRRMEPLACAKDGIDRASGARRPALTMARFLQGCSRGIGGRPAAKSIV